MHNEFSINTRNYLNCFEKILNNMIQGMTCVNLTDSVSRNFIEQMIPHHEAAIEMCKNLLQYTTFIPLQTIAQDIICEQTKSIANMRSVLRGCSSCQNSPAELCQYEQRFSRISQTMFAEMRNACAVNSIDANFIREMIPHHEGAIRMCENALCQGVCSDLVPICKAIIASQSEGIRQMECLLKQL